MVFIRVLDSRLWRSTSYPSIPMTLHDRAAYEALRVYLTNLLTPLDCPLSSVPGPLHPDLEAFLLGKILYYDAHDQPVVYGHDLMAWAYQVVYQTDLTHSLNLATVDVNALPYASAA